MSQTNGTAKLVDVDVALVVAIGPELIGERFIFSQGWPFDVAALASGKVRLKRFADCGSGGRRIGAGDDSGSAWGASESQNPAATHPAAAEHAFSQSRSQVDRRQNLPAIESEVWMRQAHRLQPMRPSSSCPLLESSRRLASHPLRWRRQDWSAMSCALEVGRNS